MGEATAVTGPGGRPRGATTPDAGASAASAAAVLLPLLFSAAVPVNAQEADPDTAPVPEAGPEESDDGHARLMVDAGAGLFAPLSNLAPSDPGDGAATPEPAPALSVAVSAGVSAVYLLSPRLGIGFHGAWSRPDVDLEPVIGDGRGDGTRRLGTADFLAASAEVVYRPLSAPGTSALDPYLSAGAGVRHLSFSDPSLADGTDPLGTVAGGVRTALGGPFFWTLEVRGFFSSTDPTARGSRVQNDVLVTVGVGARP